MQSEQTTLNGGLHQPIIIRARRGNYELVAGERRIRVAEKSGLKSFPYIVKPPSTTDVEPLEIQAIETVQREDLTPFGSTWI